MKRHLTFVLTEITMLGAYAGLTILLSDIVWMIGPKRFPSEQFYAIAIAYAALPAAFFCGLIGGWIVRGKPVVFAFVLVVGGHLLAIAATTSLLSRLHFWMAGVLAFFTASCGALLTTRVASRQGKREPVHPIRAALAGFVVMVVIWAMTYLFTKSLLR